MSKLLHGKRIRNQFQIVLLKKQNGYNIANNLHQFHETLFPKYCLVCFLKMNKITIKHSLTKTYERGDHPFFQFDNRSLMSSLSGQNIKFLMSVFISKMIPEISILNKIKPGNFDFWEFRFSKWGKMGDDPDKVKFLKIF